MTTVVGIVPAGGRGSRLAPYPGPKELFPIGWQPYSVNAEVHRRPKVVSQYVIEGMTRAGVAQIVMVVGEHKYDLLRYYGSGERFGARITYLYQEEPRGMLDAIDLALPWVDGARVAFGMPDSIVHPPDVFARLLAAHERSGADVSLALFPTTRPQKFGMVKIDAAGRVLGHVDKPAATDLTLMWGCAVWDPTFSRLIREVHRQGRPAAPRTELVLGDVLDAALAAGLYVAGLEFSDGIYIDIGTYDEIIEAQQRILEIQR